MSRHTFRAAVATVLLVVGLAFAGSAQAAPSANAGQCPGATTIGNTPTSDGSIVLDAGLSVCIHAGNGNTGTFVTDGTSTLADYILASGLLNEGGQVPNVSNYVIYEEEASSSPSSEPSSEPSSTPSSSPTSTPSPSSEPTPSESPSPSATPTSTPSSPTPSVSTGPALTPPPTDTASAPSGAATDDGLASAILGIGLTVGLMAALNHWLYGDRRRSRL
jgi:hypothetical protein